MKRLTVVTSRERANMDTNHPADKMYVAVQDLRDGSPTERLQPMRSSPKEIGRKRTIVRSGNESSGCSSGNVV